MKRAIAFALAALFGSAPALAQECARVVSMKAFKRHGGKLVRQEPKVVSLGLPPYGFFCHPVTCFGAVTIAGIVRADGAPRQLKVVENTWTSRSVLHARVSRWIVSNWRYNPPALDGRPVCVKRTWRIDFPLHKTSTK